MKRGRSTFHYCPCALVQRQEEEEATQTGGIEVSVPCYNKTGDGDAPGDLHVQFNVC